MIWKRVKPFVHTNISWLYRCIYERELSCFATFSEDCVLLNCQGSRRQESAGCKRPHRARGRRADSQQRMDAPIISIIRTCPHNAFQPKGNCSFFVSSLHLRDFAFIVQATASEHALELVAFSFAVLYLGSSRSPSWLSLSLPWSGTVCPVQV